MKLEHPGQQSTPVEVSSSGDNELIAAVVGKRIRVLSCFLISSGINTIRLDSGAGLSHLTGAIDQIAQTGFVLNYNSHGWWQTEVGQSLSVNMTQAVKLAGSINYDLVS